MLRTFKLWTSLLSPGLLALLVTGNTDPNSGDSTSLVKVRQTFEKFKIPADAHITFDPVVLLDLTFPEPPGTTPIQVMAPGSQLPQNATAGPPQFAICRGDSAGATTTASAVRGGPSLPSSGPFVVAAVDLDAPTPQTPYLAQILHFLGGGFHLDATKDPKRGSLNFANNMNLVNDTPAIAEFVRPEPPQGSDPHRYVFLLYDEPSNFSHQTLVNSSTSRLNFNISAFAIATNLGDPLGGTFILVGPSPQAAT